MKRWCNNGVIPTVRTVGGHRRIPLAAFTEFLERTNRTVQSPVVGKTQVPPNSSRDAQREQFSDALKNGDEEACRSLLTSAFAGGESMATIADDYIASAMQIIGDSWQCGDLEIYEERRGCEICSRVLHEISRLIPPAPMNAPLAIGGTPAGDQYSLPTQVVEMVLRENSWRTMNLGSNLPLETLAAAANEYSPRILWLSVSYLEDPGKFVEEYKKLTSGLPDETLIVIGGRALTDELRPKLNYTGHCDNMQQLASFCKAMHGKRHSIRSSEN